MADEKKVPVQIRVEGIAPFMMQQCMAATADQWKEKVADLAERCRDLKVKLQEAEHGSDQWVDLYTKYASLVVSLSACEINANLRQLLNGVDWTDPMFKVREEIERAKSNQQLRDYHAVEGDTAKALEDALRLLERCSGWLPTDVERDGLRQWIEAERAVLEG